MVAIDLLDMAVLRLTLAPSQHHSPVGQEHAQTIPLAVVGLPYRALGNQASRHGIASYSSDPTSF